jgi:hypothetical protein
MEVIGENEEGGGFENGVKKGIERKGGDELF